MASQREFSNKNPINYNYYYDYALSFMKIGRASALIICLELKKQNLTEFKWYVNALRSCKVLYQWLLRNKEKKQFNFYFWGVFN